MIYQKSGSYETLEDYVKQITGKNIAELNNFQPCVINGLDKVIDTITRYIKAGKLIAVFGDYDVDGVGAVLGLEQLLLSLGCTNCILLCPRRFTDGYGINERIINNIDASLLITIDNGITAVKAIKAAKEKGMEVIVLDHHLAIGEIPPADIIIDPEAFPETANFNKLCGAAIAFELCKMVISNPDQLAWVNAYAAIGTIADSVPLYGENRKIVQDGLSFINNGKISVGLKALFSGMGYDGKKVFSDDIGYYIAPAINAPGRLIDTGAMAVARTLSSTDPVKANAWVSKMIEINNVRKELVNSALNEITEDPTDPVNFIQGDVPAGCLGIVAGKMAEKTGKPSFLFGKANESGICKGSARISNDDKNNSLETLLQSCQDILVSWGGHREAAGFSFMQKDMDKVHERIAGNNIIPVVTGKFYDLDLTAANMNETIAKLDQIQPFGVGLPKPTFRMPCRFTGDSYFTTMGADSQHLRFDFENHRSAVLFNMSQKYFDDGNPKNIYLYGDLKWNSWKGTATPQFIAKDYEKM